MDTIDALFTANGSGTSVGLKVGAGKTLNATDGTVLLPAAASPAQTADGSVVWDSDDNLLTVGDGSSRKVMVDTTSTQTLTNKTLTSPVISTISNTGTLTLPTSTDTIVGRATTDTLTNKTLTSPTINTPTLSTPAITGGTINNAVIGGSTPAAGTFTALTDSKGDVRAIPQNSQGSSYTLVASDNGKHILASSTVIVPASIFSVGDVVTVVNNTSGDIAVNGSGVTLRLVGTTTTGNRTLKNYGLCSILCIASNTFIVAGSVT
jgi:hypothetical protein